MPPDDWHFPRAGTSGSPFALLESMLASANISAAWDRVRRNDGAPGVDGMSVRALQDTFAVEWPLVERRLRAGTWQPLPVRRVLVPKPDGGTRVLGIPTVLDRVVHQAVSQVLTPLWEPRFSRHSFAYRRGRGVREAMESLATQAARFGQAPAAWHLDIRQFFDRVPREHALKAVRRVADDARLISLVGSILDAGACENGVVVPTPAGLPQGSPLSPLLANAVLHPLDVWLEQEAPGFARYADDIVVLMPSHEAVRQAQPELAARLERLGLELNTDKTAATALPDMRFLGFALWQDAAGCWRRRISPAAWDALEAEMARRDRTSWALCGDDGAVAADYLTGWLAHFGITECPHDRARIERLRAQHPQPGGQPAAKVRMPYDGGYVRKLSVPGQTPPFCKGGCEQPPRSGTGRPEPRPQWSRTLRLWLARARAGRLVRVGLDMARQHGGFLPRPTALRITLLGFTLRLRL